MRKQTLIAASAAALILPAAGSATATAPVNDTLADTSYEREDDDDGFPWGLLGLIGLAGLLGRKRDNHVHVDRHDTTRNPRV